MTVILTSVTLRMAQCLQVLSLVILLLVCHGSSDMQHCSTVVTVDQSTTTNAFCNSTTLEANGTCSDLQEALLLIAQSRSTRNALFNQTPSVSCIEVRVLPGRYVISDFIEFEGRNVAIRGIKLVEVSFNFSDKFDPTEIDPVYIMSFKNTGFAEISAINFSNSPGIITFENVSNVIVKESSFSYFYQGAVDIFNCVDVSVTESQFSHCGPVAVIKNQTYRGHAGGLSVGYNFEADSLIPLHVLIADSNFINNSARALSDSKKSTSQLLRQLLFTGRGGGCAVILNSVLPITVKVERCMFEENYALSFGGGLYIGWGALMQHNVTVVSSKFLRNQTPGAAGGLEMGFAQGGGTNSFELANRIAVFHSEFIENQARYGAGAYFFVGASEIVKGAVGNFARFENCTFSGNRAEEYGGGLGAIIPAANIIFESRENIRPLEIVNCTFTDNDGSGGGTMSTAYFPIRFDGVNIFANNRARTMVILSALVRVYGTLKFIGNVATGSDGGALYATSLGQVQLFDGGSISFEDNQGNLGASLVVDSLYVPPMFSQLIYNPLCFLLLQQPTQTPIQKGLDSIGISFSGNRAVVGSAVYANNLALCSWSQTEEPLFNSSLAFRWNFVNYSDDNCNSAHVGSECSPQWYVQTPVTRLALTDDVITAYPGENFNLGVMAFDELEELTAAVFRLSDMSTSDNTSGSDQGVGLYRFNPSVVSHDSIELAGVGLSFQALAEHPSNVTQAVNVQTLLTDNEFSNLNTFQVEVVSCPAGYNLAHSFDNETFTCQCDFNNTDIISCDGRKILLMEGLWGTVASGDSGALSLVTHACPWGYCRCALETISAVVVCSFAVNSSDIDAQCSCDREGTLCGDCRGGKGVSALFNRCVSCEDISVLFIVALVLCNVAVFTVILLFFPRVPSWVYPCVFYVQILPYLSEHFPLTFERFQQPVHYVAAALGFYFPFDVCLYSNMSPLVSYFLRFVPLFISLVLCPVVLSLRRFVPRHNHRVPWHGLWWIVLFQYTHVVHTALSILNCPRLPGPDGDTVPRWYVSGSVKCFNEWHAPLGVLAILVLMLCVALIPLTALISLGQIQRPSWMSRLVEPLTLTFHMSYKWWAAVELTRRVLILVFIVAFPRNNFPASVIIMLIILLYGFLLPYVSKVGIVLEIVLSLDVLILLLLRNISQATDELQTLPFSFNNLPPSLECIDDRLQTPTPLAWLLFPFYYIPLVVLVIAALIWIGIKLLRCVRKCSSKDKETLIIADDMTEIERSLDAVLRRAPSRSEVDFGSIKQVRALGRDRQVYVTNNNLSMSQEVEQSDSQVPMIDVSYVRYSDQDNVS